MGNGNDTSTCPKCGALIVAQLNRCRQCKAYLHGTNLEGFLIENVLGGMMSHAPGTAALCLMIALFYGMMGMLAGPISFLSFSGFSLQQLGATHGSSILRGQYWRFVTSIFAHHDLLHIALNLWCLTMVGPLVETIFDRKKMIILYVVAGVSSMMFSHVWYTFVVGQVVVVSAGASGAVCGMIGAAWVGGRRLGPQGAELARQMKRWTVLMVVWGLLVPGINNAAHGGGFVVGAALAYVVPVGLTQSVRTQKVLSVVVLSVLAGVVASTGMMLANLRGYPAALEYDMYPKTILGRTISDGTEPASSDQSQTWRACLEQVTGRRPEDALTICELNLRINDSEPIAYETRALIADRLGDAADAKALRKLSRRLGGPPPSPDRGPVDQ